MEVLNVSKESYLKNLSKSMGYRQAIFIATKTSFA